MTDRFQLVKSPALDPGTDIITGTTVGPFVDCGAWIQPSPRRRRIYLSVETVRQLAEAAGITQAPIDEAAVARYRAEGALDFLRENLHGDLASVVRRLAAFLDDAGVVVDPGSREGAGADG